MPDAIYPDRKWTNYCRYGERQQEHGRQGMKSTPEICWRRDDHYLTNQYQTQKKIQKPEKVSARSELQKNVCQQTCDIFKIHCTGLETGYILSYLSEDTLLKFLFL